MDNNDEKQREDDLAVLLADWENVPTHLIPSKYELAPGQFMNAVKAVPDDAKEHELCLSWDEYIHSNHINWLWGCIDPIKASCERSDGSKLFDPKIEVEATNRVIFGTSKPLEILELFRDLLSLGDVEDRDILDAALHVCHTMQQYCGLEGVGNYLDFVKKLAAFQTAMTGICEQLPSGRVVLQEKCDLQVVMEARKIYRFLCQNVEYTQSWYAQSNLWGRQAAVICRINQLHLKRILGLAPVEQKAELFDAFHMQLAEACKKVQHFGKILQNDSIIA